MYKIYADGKLLHAPHLVLDGCGVFSPKLTTELNKADSLDFTIPPNNSLYDDISKLKSIITVYQHDQEIFRGRILYDEKDFYKQKKTTCEGELAFLLDSKQRPYTFNGTAGNLFKQYINNHNARVEASKQFTIGNITAAGASMTVHAENKEYPSTLDEINSQIVNTFGGYLKVRGSGDTRYIDWLEEYGVSNTQTIEFGVNLLDITEYISAEDVYTVLIPLGASRQDEEGNDLGRLTISSVNSNKDYLENATAISLFGRIEQSVTWDEIEDAASLKKVGETTLSQNIEMAVTLTVKAVDLHTLSIDIERIKLGDNVRVISLPHGLDRYFRCTKITYDMTNPDQTEYVFGVNYTALTDMQASREKNINEAMTVVNSAKNAINYSVNTANQASQQVQQVISELPTAYVQTATFNALEERVSDLEEGGGGGGTAGVTSFNGRTGAVVPMSSDYTPSFIGAASVLAFNDLEDRVGQLEEGGGSGGGSGDMLASVYDPQGKQTDIFRYVDDRSANIPITDEVPEDADIWIDPSEEGSGGGSVGGGAYIGAEEPTDENVNLWYDTDEEQGQFYTAAEADAKFMPINLGVQMVKLWENPNPDAAFAAQTINLDLSEYHHVKILFEFWIAASNRRATTFFEMPPISCGKPVVCSFFNESTSGYNSMTKGSRTVTCSSSGVEFSDGYAMNLSKGETDNNRMVPSLIYGIKGVQ